VGARVPGPGLVIPFKASREPKAAHRRRRRRASPPGLLPPPGASALRVYPRSGSRIPPCRSSGFEVFDAQHRPGPRPRLLPQAWRSLQGMTWRPRPPRRYGAKASFLGFRSPATVATCRSPRFPGLPHPGSFRPRRFTRPRRFAPPAGFRPFSGRCRSWGSPFRALLLPGSRAPLGVRTLLPFTDTAFLHSEVSGRTRSSAATGS
jgi:hypothetical protein